MIKVRLTYVDNEKGSRELETLINKIKENSEILHISDPYSQRGNSNYKSIYIDIEVNS